MNFKKNFKYLCDEKGIKDLKELAEKANVNLSTLYSLLEDGNLPTYEIAISLCNYFDCSLDFLLGLTDVVEKSGEYVARDFVKNYEKILKEKRTNNYRVCREIGIDKDRIYDWRKGSYPYLDTLKKLADYFGVPLDYFATKHEDA